jgi:hypothetical protein
MGSHGLEAFCLDASYIAAFNILNLPSLANPEGSRPLSSNLSWLASSNVTIYTDDRASILANFKYEEIASLPLAKPLAIQCPVPACIFPISGYFTFLQRLLLYINIGIATFALHVPLLRGVSQIWLTTFWFSVLFMFVATIATTKVPMIYNLDFQPATLVVHVGFLPTLLWFSFRAEPAEPRHTAGHALVQAAAHLGDSEDTKDPEDPRAAEIADVPERSREIIPADSWYQKWKRQFTDFPITRILVPIYGIFGVANIIIANVTEDPAGFWPKATAVVLSNGTNHLLAGPCFEDLSGFVGLWPPSPSPYNGIRALNSLSIYYPPPESSAVDALQSIPKAALIPLHAGSVLICFVIFILSFIKLNSLEERLRRMYVMNLALSICLRFLKSTMFFSSTSNTTQV